MIFIEQFKSEIGMYLEILEGPSTLGTKVMYEPLILFKHRSPL